MKEAMVTKKEKWPSSPHNFAVAPLRLEEIIAPHRMCVGVVAGCSCRHCLTAHTLPGIASDEWFFLGFVHRPAA